MLKTFAGVVGVTSASTVGYPAYDELLGRSTIKPVKPKNRIWRKPEDGDEIEHAHPPSSSLQVSRSRETSSQDQNAQQNRRYEGTPHNIALRSRGSVDETRNTMQTQNEVEDTMNRQMRELEMQERQRAQREQEVNGNFDGNLEPPVLAQPQQRPQQQQQQQQSPQRPQRREQQQQQQQRVQQSAQKQHHEVQKKFNSLPSHASPPAAQQYQHVEVPRQVQQVPLAFRQQQIQQQVQQISRQQASQSMNSDSVSGVSIDEFETPGEVEDILLPVRPPQVKPQNVPQQAQERVQEEIQLPVPQHDQIQHRREQRQQSAQEVGQQSTQLGQQNNYNDVVEGELLVDDQSTLANYQRQLYNEKLQKMNPQEGALSYDDLDTDATYDAQDYDAENYQQLGYSIDDDQNQDDNGDVQYDDDRSQPLSLKKASSIGFGNANGNANVLPGVGAGQGIDYSRFDTSTITNVNANKNVYSSTNFAVNNVASSPTSPTASTNFVANVVSGTVSTNVAVTELEGQDLWLPQCQLKIQGGAPSASSLLEGGSDGSSDGVSDDDDDMSDDSVDEFDEDFDENGDEITGEVSFLQMEDQSPPSYSIASALHLINSGLSQFQGQLDNVRHIHSTTVLSTCFREGLGNSVDECVTVLTNFKKFCCVVHRVDSACGKGTSDLHFQQVSSQPLRVQQSMPSSVPSAVIATGTSSSFYPSSTPTTNSENLMDFTNSMASVNSPMTPSTNLQSYDTAELQYSPGYNTFDAPAEPTEPPPPPKEDSYFWKMFSTRKSNSSNFQQQVDDQKQLYESQAHQSQQKVPEFDQHVPEGEPVPEKFLNEPVQPTSNEQQQQQPETKSSLRSVVRRVQVKPAEAAKPKPVFGPTNYSAYDTVDDGLLQNLIAQSNAPPVANQQQQQPMVYQQMQQMQTYPPQAPMMPFPQPQFR